MRAHGSIVVLLVALHGCSSDTAAASTTDPLVACTADKLPVNGAKCDTAKYDVNAYCRLQDCSGQCLDECSCVDGRWKCGSSCRDNYGCGTPPLCRTQPCSSGGIDAGVTPDSAVDTPTVD